MGIKEVFSNFDPCFEFDARKSLSNEIKHGIDFFEAQELWKSSFVVVPGNSAVEDRFLIIGTIQDKHWTAIVTARHSTIRLISVRRSRAQEILILRELSHDS